MGRVWGRTRARQDSNLRPRAPEARALSTELRALGRRSLALKAMLTEPERDCLSRYCGLLATRLPDLVVVRMFGSAARGDMWPAGSPMHSDIDLLVVTREAVPEALQEELANETYPLYLESGRQLSPHF